FAENLGRDALLHVRHAPSVGDEALHRLAHDVDEAGRGGETVAVDLRSPASIDDADRGDAVAGDGDVAVSRLTAAAVVDGHVADDCVVRRPRRGAGGEREYRKKEDESPHTR